MWEYQRKLDEEEERLWKAGILSQEKLKELMTTDLHKKEEKEEKESVSEEEILKGIDQGLKEMKERHESGGKGKTLEEL